MLNSTLSEMMYKCKRWLVVALVVSSAGCQGPDDQSYSRVTNGYKPVYASSEVREILFQPPREVRNPGKIYLYGDYLLVNEREVGIHVFNNADPSNPVSLGFFNILGNHDMAIRNDILYADYQGNIVAIEMKNMSDFVVTATLPLRNWNLGIPPPSGAYFECVEPEKGIVVQWDPVENLNMDCYAY